MSCYFCDTEKSQPEYRPDRGYSFCQCDVCGRYVVTESEILRWQRTKLNKDIVAAYLYHNVRLYADERDPSYACVVCSGSIPPAFFEEHPYFHEVSYDVMQAYYPKTMTERTQKILRAIKKQSRFSGDQIEMSVDEATSLLFIYRFDGNGKKLEDIDINIQFEQIITHIEEKKYANISHDGFGKVYMRLSPKGQEYVESIEPETSDNTIASSFLASHIDELLKAERSGNDADAIGKAKELIESCCRTILDQRKDSWDKNWALHELTGKTMETLGIRGKDVQGTEDIDISTKALLSNLAQISQRVAEIRNIACSGHGRPESFKPVEHRYARLAVGASIAFVRFLWETHMANKK